MVSLPRADVPVRSSVLRTPLASRSSFTRTPCACTRSTTSCLRSSGSNSSASPASSIAANSSDRPFSDSFSFDSVISSRGNTESPIGPSMTSVRSRSRFIQSMATLL